MSLSQVVAAPNGAISQTASRIASYADPDAKPDGQAVSAASARGKQLGRIPLEA
jgi:hypothetical protein